MTNHFAALAGLGIMMAGVLPSIAASASVNEERPVEVLPDIRDEMVLGGQVVKLKHVIDAPIEGWKEVMLATGEVFYTDPEQRYVIVGTLYENTEDHLFNVTELLRQQERLNALSGSGVRDSFVTFRAPDEIGEITVFTDISCSYCRMFHGDIDAINAAGITVNYLPFPRMGLSSPVAQQLSEIWCSDSSQEKLSKAFDPGMSVENDERAWEQCGGTVANGYALGHSFGIEGTPATVLPNGEMGEGYMPVEHLVHAFMSSITD
ncbi:MAG: thioredoxin fold domain-containing protein [Halomonas sp.]|nr:thioredoxin fold domain-containing protein [Halomonas sp.]MCC5902712.1 thioredoxin fold domain-containing protein [Halomonas sp.]